MSEETEVKIEEQIIESEGIVVPDPVEVKARTQGWVPKEEFRGDPDKWIEAEVFNKRGETIIPIMKERNERLEKEIRGMKDSFKEFSDFHKQTEERSYQKALKEIERQKLVAVESADTEGYQTAESERIELEKTRPVAIKVEKPAELPEMQEFRKANPWYDSDSELTMEADALGIAYAKQNMPYSKILEKVQNTLKILHPEKFTNVKRDSVSLVESVSSETGLPKKSNNHAYENLPADAKKQCN